MIHPTASPQVSYPVVSPDVVPDGDEAITPHPTSPQTFKKKTVSGVLSFLGRTFLLQIFGFIAQFLLSSKLQAEEFGIYGVVMLINSLLTFFSDIGLGATIIQRKQEPTITEYRTVFTIQQLLTWSIFFIATGLVYFGLVPQQIGWEGNILLLTFALALPLTSLRTIPTLILERRLDFSKIAFTQVVEQIIYNIALIYLVLNDYGILSFAIAVMIRTIAGIGAMYSVQSWNIGASLNTSAIQAIIGTGFKFQASDLLARIKDQIFFLVLANYLPIREFGYIQWAKSWSQYPYNLTVQNVIQITFPVYARLKHDPVLLKKAIEKSLFFISLGILPIVTGMSLFIYPFTQVFDRWQKWEPATLTFILFTVSIGFAAVSTPLTNTLNAIGKINKTLGLMVFWTSLTWIITPLCVWYFDMGFDGVAVASCIIAVTSVLPIIMVQRIIPFNFIQQVWPQFMASMGMVVIGVLGMEYWSRGWIEFILGLGLTGLTFILLMAILAYHKTKQEIYSLFRTTP